MSWICDYCSTSNEDSSTECFVCGESRSEASLREARARLHEERVEKFNKLFYKWSMGISRTIFIASTISFTVAALIIIVMKLMNGSIDDFVNAIIQTGAHVGNNIALTFTQNGVKIIENMSYSTLFDMGDNIEYIAIKCQSVFEPNLEFLALFFGNAIEGKIYFLTSYGENIGNSIDSVCEGVVSYIEHGVKRIKENLSLLHDKGEFVINNIGEKF